MELDDDPACDTIEASILPRVWSHGCCVVKYKMDVVPRVVCDVRGG